MKISNKLSTLASLGTVFSTEVGRVCPDCGKATAVCSCKSDQAAALLRKRTGGSVRVGRETKGRAGKGVTVIHGLPLSADALTDLASALKKRCGSGGTVVDGVIEIQGEHRDTLMTELTRRGFQVKRSGG